MAYDEFGDLSDPVILLIMGLGTQMIAWPEGFCQGLATRGYRVIRFDNRDIGLSQKMDGARVPGMLKRVAVLKKITAPTLVIHGEADPLVPVSGGIDTARHVRGAKLELIAGMGHDLPKPLLPHFVELNSTHADAC